MPKPSERRVVPRWRTSRNTLAADFPKSRVVARPVSKETRATVARRAAEFLQQPSVGLAADLLAYSPIHALRSTLEDAASFVARLPDGEVPKPLRDAANSVTGGTNSSFGPAQTVQEDIRYLRTRLRANPRDAIGHVDIARAFTISGNNEAAARHLGIAAQLAPNNRFILRSAARFFTHRSEPDRARHLLANSPKTARDPWLMASLVSFETILNENKSSGRALKMLKDERHAAADIAELACALSVVEYRQGAWRESRKLLNKGLVAPNDNAVAQALWFVDSTGFEIRAQDAWLRNNFAAEARFYERHSTGDFESAVNEALAWYRDEPFSTRPLQAASYLLSILGRYDEAKRWALEGLRLRAGDSALRNNLAFVLMASGALKEGEAELRKAIEVERSESTNISPHTKANVGMLCYRHGEFEAGERLYRAAATEYISLRARGYEPAALALAHMALEATRSEAPNAGKLLAEAETNYKKHSFSDARIVLDSIKKTKLGAASEPAPPKTPLVLDARSWRHDPTTNVLIVENLKPFKE